MRLQSVQLISMYSPMLEINSGILLHMYNPHHIQYHDNLADKLNSKTKKNVWVKFWLALQFQLQPEFIEYIYLLLKNR